MTFCSWAKPGNSGTNQVTKIWLKNYKHTTYVLRILSFHIHTRVFKQGRNFAYEVDGFKNLHILCKETGDLCGYRL